MRGIIICVVIILVVYFVFCRPVKKNPEKEKYVENSEDLSGSFPGKINGKYPLCQNYDSTNQMSCPWFGRYTMDRKDELVHASACRKLARPEFEPCEKNEMRFSKDLGGGRQEAYCCLPKN
jgi:hypothetical protein